MGWRAFLGAVTREGVLGRGGGRSRSRRRRPRLEVLEERRPLAAGLPAFSSISGGLNPTSITSGPDGNLWVTVEPDRRDVLSLQPPRTAGAIERITPAGIVAEFALPAYTGGSSITPGPDGNLWFLESTVRDFRFPASSSIARITPSGTITRFALPGSVGDVQELTTGPDGNLWFDTIQGLSRIAPDGTITMAPFDANASGHASPGGDFVFGLDGTLWFPELLSSGSAIDRVTPTGGFARFPVDTPSVFPRSLVVGPDGNIWFTESIIEAGGVAKVGRITPDGAVVTFLPPARGTLGDIAAGADGRLYTVESARDPVTSAPILSIDRVTTKGAITEIPVPLPTAGGFLEGAIASGPDGNIWFTEFGSVAVGRLEIAAPSTPAPTVAGVERLDAPGRQTALVVTFRGALDPAPAQALRNFSIVAVQPHARPAHQFGPVVPLASAVYDASAHSVTLYVRGKLKPRSHYRLRVAGMPATGLASPGGVYLGGMGGPGVDVVAVIPDAARGARGARGSSTVVSGSVKVGRP